MASQEVLDFGLLLAPISEEHPAGVELRVDPAASPLFFQVKESRDAARAAERALLYWYGDEKVPRPDPPNWRPVAELSQRILSEKSKDLWVCAWFLESLVRLHGFAGLRDGLRLIREICQQYWSQIHPVPNEEGYAHTTSQLAGVFDGALSVPIDSIPITPALATQRALNAMDYKDAPALDKLDADARSNRVAQGAATREMFDRAIHADHIPYYRNLLEDIDGSMQEFLLLAEQLEQCCGNDEAGYSAAPPTSSVRESITSVRDLVQSLTRGLLGQEAAEQPSSVEEAGESSAGATGPAAGTAAVGAIRTREEAFRALLLVADFFRRTEPHSPVSYSLEQAVRWGRMPFPQLMGELIADDSVRRDMLRRVGVSESSKEDD
jgi:type VI secretion system protein ImpA